MFGAAHLRKESQPSRFLKQIKSTSGVVTKDLDRDYSPSDLHPGEEEGATARASTSGRRLAPAKAPTSPSGRTDNGETMVGSSRSERAMAGAGTGKGGKKSTSSAKASVKGAAGGGKAKPKPASGW